MCFYDDGDYCEGWTEAERKARKAHRCHECGGPINPGETYRYYSWVGEDGPGSFKECAKCRRARELVHDAEVKEGCSEHESWCPLGVLGDAIGDHDDGYGLLHRDDATATCRVAPEAAHLFPGFPRVAP